MKRIVISSLLSLLILWPLSALSEITQNDRLLQRPEWDGAVVQKNWVQGELRFQKWDNDDFEANTWSLGPTFITSLPNLRSLELGGRLSLMSFDPDYSETENGISDVDVWGKYQIFMLSVGALLTLPTGSDDIIHPRSSGAVNMEFFAAGRFNASPQLAVVAHCGLRKNSDADIKINRFKTEIDGEMQMEIGGGVIYEVSSQLNLLGELNIATEPYDDFDNDIELTGGVEYKLQQDLSLRGGLGIGLDEGAPEYELLFGCVYMF